MSAPADGDWLATIPKVELHCHLEGAIPLDCLLELIRRHGGDPAVRSVEDLRRRFHYRSFHDFIAAWVWKNRWIRTVDDIVTIAEAVGRRLLAQRIVHAELTVSPVDFAAHGVGVADYLRAVRRGLDASGHPSVLLICDLVRDYGPQRAGETLDALASCRDLVAAVGLGGSEREHPAEDFAAVFRRAAHLGLHRTIHAGEAAGAASVRAAVETCGAERIGHGIRAIEDPAVVRLLADRRIPLEVCPVSNLCTQVVADIAHHPVTRLRAAGCLVTISTDDPGMFGNTLAGEFGLLATAHGWSRADIRQATEAAACAAFLDGAARDCLLTAIRSDPSWSGTVNLAR